MQCGVGVQTHNLRASSEALAVRAHGLLRPVRQQATKGVAAVAEHTGDIFPDERGGRTLILFAGLIDGIGKLHIAEGERAARIGQAEARAGNAE